MTTTTKKARKKKAAISFCAFARDVLHIELTPAQRVWCSVAFDGIDAVDLRGHDRAIARQLFGDAERVPELARKVVVAVKGRRVGGTYLCALRGLHLMLTASLPSLAPGEIAYAAVVAPDKKTAAQALRFALGAVASSPSISRMVESETAEGFVLKRRDGRRVAFEVFAASRAGSSLRGRTLISLHMTEAAFFRAATDGVVNDEDVFTAGRPAVIPGGQLMIESSPWTERGLLWDMWRQHGEPKTALVAHMPTLAMRTDDESRSMVAAERARDPDRSLREHDALFVGEGASELFSRELLEACTSTPVPEGEPVYSAGADLGYVRDSSALVILARRGEHVEVADQLRITPAADTMLSPDDVVDTFAAVLKRYGCTTVTVDVHGYAHAWSRLQRHGITAVQLTKGKGEAFLGLRIAMRCGRVTIPADAGQLRAELRDTIAKPTPSGAYAIDHPRRAGSHGDVADALAHAYVSADWSRQFETWQGGDVSICTGAGIDSTRDLAKEKEQADRERKIAAGEPVTFKDGSVFTVAAINAEKRHVAEKAKAERDHGGSSDRTSPSIVDWLVSSGCAVPVQIVATILPGQRGSVDNPA